MAERKTRNDLTKETKELLKEEIKSYLRDGYKAPISKIAKQFDISLVTASRYRTIAGRELEEETKNSSNDSYIVTAIPKVIIPTTESESIITDKEEDKPVNTKSSIDENNITVIRTGVVKCGLINDRHQMPVNKYIFDRIEQDDINNFTLLDSIVSQFIIENVGIEIINGEYVAKNRLVVYCTGLVMANASLVKMCEMYHVNLTLNHYNPRTNDYDSQVIFNKFNTNKIENIFGNVCGEINLVDLSEEYILSGGDFYCIKKYVKEKVNTPSKQMKIYCYPHDNSVFEFYCRVMANSMGKQSLETFFLEDGCVSNNGLYKRKNFLCRTYNFEVLKQNN